MSRIKESKIKCILAGKYSYRTKRKKIDGNRKG